MAKVSIHCDGTEIYITPEEKKSKSNDAAPKEKIELKEQEISGGYSQDTVIKSGNGNETNGHKAPDDTEYHPLYPYELKSVSKNGESNGNGVMILEKSISTNELKLKKTAVVTEEKHRTIVDQIPDAYFAVDLKGDFIFVNDTLCKFLGYTKQELTGMACRDHVSEESYETVYRAFEYAFEAGTEVRDLRCQVVRKDGSVAITEMSAYLLKDESGEVSGFRCIGRDVTERVRREEALKQALERYQSVVEEIDEIYFEVDLSGNFTYVNDAGCRTLRRSRQELVGMNYRCYIPEDEIDSVYQAWNKVYRTGESLMSYHHANVKNCGKRVYLENSVSPVRNAEGKITGFRSLCHDATEREVLTRKLVELKWPAQTD